MRRIVIAGVTSGVGKTAIACAIMAAFARRGIRVQPFKVGPDYIDPSHHTLAAGRPSRNLDTVLTSPATMVALFRRVAATADLSIVEGVMGLFDGRNGQSDEGSTAQVAKLLGAPVVVVLDVARTSRSAGAIALGCVQFDRSVDVAGFILNRVGSETHARWATEAVESATGLPVLGVVRRDDALTLPERHLGLVPTAEDRPAADHFDRLAAVAEQQIDLDRLWQLARTSPLPMTPDDPFPPAPQPVRARIAIAHDQAFNFYYADGLDLLQAWGAELLPFSPLADRAIPPDAQGIYIGGGFPELFAAALAANEPMLDALRRAWLAGLPIYGECGGLMYLGQVLVDFDGVRHRMAGIVPIESRMERRVRLGYRTVRAVRSSPLLPAGSRVRGHEFHYSTLEAPIPAEQAAYAVEEPSAGLEGYLDGKVLASYVHLHFGADAALAQRFVDICAAVAPIGAGSPTPAVRRDP